MKKLRVALMYVLVPVLSCLFVSAAHSDDGFGGYAQDGAYVGLSFVQNSVRGSDFNGDVAFVGSSEAFAVPSLDSAAGFGALFGVRKSAGAMELGYSRSTHDATWGGLPLGEASVNAIDANFKYHWLRDKKIQPYVLGGCGIVWITAENAAVDINDEVSDATFLGFGLNVGAGLSYYFTPKIALTGGALYRLVGFTSIDGNTVEDLACSTLTYTVGVTYAF